MTADQGPAQSVRRIAGILLAFTGDRRLLGVTEIARQLGLSKSVVHRNLDSLVTTGLISRDPGTSRYRLGASAVLLGFAALGAPDIRLVGLPIMQELSNRTRETVTMSLRTGFERVYVLQVEGPQEVRMTIDVGKRFPLYAGASGRAILALIPKTELERYLSAVALQPLTSLTVTDVHALARLLEAVRQSGYAVSHGERDPSAAAVAAPFFNGPTVIGSISICGPTNRFTRELSIEYGALVSAAARELADQLQ